MSAALRIVFMGTPDFALPSLQTLLDGPDQVVAVVCQPDRQRGRGKVLSAPPVKLLAQKYQLPVLQPEDVREERFLAQLRILAPDILVVTAYGKILPESLLALPGLGAINVHGSLLPKYRGAAPIQWAIVNGETETGITIMQMNAGMDTGDILLTAATPIAQQETAGELFIRLAHLGGTTLAQALVQLKQGQLHPKPQDHTQASPAPMLHKKMGHIDWHLPATQLHCLIRGLDPWPSAYGFINTLRYRFFAPQLFMQRFEQAPGTICRINRQGIVVATGAGSLLLGAIQPEGKKYMPLASCFHSLPLQPGTVIT